MTSLLFYEFTCESCGTRISKPSTAFDHDHCPECMYSKHVSFGFADQAPCMGLMKPHAPFDKEPGIGMWVCEGCDYAYRNPLEYVATVERYRQLEMARHQVRWLWDGKHPRGAAIWRKVKGEWRAEILVEPVYVR